MPVRPQMTPNARWQFVLVYTEPERGQGACGIEDVAAAVRDGAVRVGEEAGLPLHVFPLAETAAAHQAVRGRRRRQGAHRRHRLSGSPASTAWPGSRAPGSRMALSDSSQTEAKRTLEATSVGQCIPRYSRLTSTKPA